MSLVSTPSPGPLDDPTHMMTIGANYDLPKGQIPVDEHSTIKDKAKTTTREGSSIITLCPYTPPRTQQKKTKKYGQKVKNFDEMFGPQKWTKYFEMGSNIDDDLELYKNLAKKVGADVLFRHQKDGVTVIEASSEEQSEKLKELIIANDPSLPVKENLTLNVCYGTVVIPNNLYIGSIEFNQCGNKIKDNITLQNYDIRDIITYTRPPRGNRKYELRIAKIAFEGRALPDTVVIGGQRLSVREYLPTPRQCIKCWRYGHGIKYCKSDLYVCPICSVRGHQKDSCNQSTRKVCVNCLGEHPAFSRSCSQYKREQLIVKTQFKEGLSYKAAISKLKQTGEITSYNYKKALEKQKTLVTSTPKVSNFITANRFTVLETEESQNPDKNIPPKAPKKTKRFRHHSSEEGGLSPEMSPKQKPKRRYQNNELEVTEIVADIHNVNEVLSMDDTIIYTEDDHEDLNVKTTLSSETTIRADLLPKSALPTDVPSTSPLPTDMPSTTPLPTDVPLKTPAPTDMPSTTPLPTDVPLESPLPADVPLEPSLTNNKPSKSSKVINRKDPKLVPKTVPEEKPGIDDTKIKKPEAIKNVKLETHQKDSKIPRRIITSGTNQNKTRSLIQDFHMPPGYKYSK